MRRPFALANWKMAMTIGQSLEFIHDVNELVGDLLDDLDVVICPPYTALWPVAEALEGSRMQLGGQNIAPSADLARTGQVSATLLSDVGCQWVMLGHWEIRRFLGDDDATVHRKVHLALEAGLKPIILIGEARNDAASDEVGLEAALGRRLAQVLAGCRAKQVAEMALVYEPEGAIGVSRPVPPDRVAVGCKIMRDWLRLKWGATVAESVRIIYGGSVTPEHAEALLSASDVDGLGASRRGRDPTSFGEIVQEIARAKRNTRGR